MRQIALLAVLLLSGCFYQAARLEMDMARTLAECAPLCPDGHRPVQAVKVFDRVNARAILDCGCMKEETLVRAVTAER